MLSKPLLKSLRQTPEYNPCSLFPSPESRSCSSTLWNLLQKHYNQRQKAPSTKAKPSFFGMMLAFLQESVGLHGKEVDTVVRFKQVWIIILCKLMPFSLSKPVPPWLGLNTHVPGEKAVHLCWTIRLCQEADCLAGFPWYTLPSWFQPLCGNGPRVGHEEGRISLTTSPNTWLVPGWVPLPLPQALDRHRSSNLSGSWNLSFQSQSDSLEEGRGAELATSPIYWWQL